MNRIKVKDILNTKSKKKIICLTSYTKNFSQILDKYCDIILVGDSVSMVLYGMPNTREITLETMMLHAKTVKKYTKRSLVVFDMPFRSYRNKYLAYKNAKRVIKETKCDAVKLEGGIEIAKTIKHLTQKGISVMGHIGLLPQNSKNFKLQGKTIMQKKKIFNDAISVFKAGAFSLVIECVVESLAKKITKSISIPTIGIGASKHCDGQILVTEDMIGLTDFSPKFVKKYSNIRKIIEKSVKRYSDDIRNQKFPSSQNVYS